MKILYGYPQNEGYNNRTNLTEIRLKQIERLSDAGFNVKPFPIGFNKKLQTVNFKQLDRLWKYRDRLLMSMYDRFIKEINECDVFYNSVGMNFHPEFIQSIPKFTVFGCNDDPESSEVISKPVATSYDMCAIGNIAEIDTYKSWGVKNVVWQPMGIEAHLYNPNLKYEDILFHERNINVSMIIDKLSRYRVDRMRKIEKAFPNGHFYGRGWNRGYLPQGQEVELLQKTKIGINIHNSTGPINTRLYYLPANGIMQICDNKTHLSKVYKLNEEVVGFDSIEECIDLCHYYLKHDDERRYIAANGWKRVITEYNEFSVFQRLIDNIQKAITEKKAKRIDYQKRAPGLLNACCSKIFSEYTYQKKHLRSKASKLYRRYVH